VNDKKNYTLPNFTVRDLEIQRLKNNKSRKSDKNDMMSVKSKTSKFGAGARGIGKAQPSDTESSQIGGRSNTGSIARQPQMISNAKRSSQPVNIQKTNPSSELKG
jgi:hypothetical protein